MMLRWRFCRARRSGSIQTGGTLMYTSQLHVVPDYDIAIAVTFAGMVDTDAVLTQITQSLLEEKHVLTLKSSRTPASTRCHTQSTGIL